MSDFTPTEDMVLQKERQNAARRGELQKRSKHISSDAEQEPNFPPECCCVKPLIYHNIRVQVPVPQQRFMYILCSLYISLLILIVYNIVASLIYFILGGSTLHFGLSFIYLIGIPGAWICWYYNLYIAMTQNSRPRQIMGLFGLFLGVAFDAWMAVGVVGLGGCGWMVTVLSISSLPAFIVLIIAAILWTLHGLLMIVMFFRYWKASEQLLKGGAYIYQQTPI